MAQNVFLSFAIEDRSLVDLFRGQARNSRLPLEFRDHSVKEPFERAWKTRAEDKIRRSSAAVCLVGRETYRSDAVDWEIRKSAELGNGLLAVYVVAGFPPLPSALQEYSVNPVVNGGEIMYRQGGSRAEMWRLKSVPPVAFNQERPNLTEGGLDVQGGYLPPCSQGLFRRRDERPRGGPSVRATPGHGAQDARVLRAPRVSTATTGSQTEARSI